MRYFLDTEFCERPNSLALISIGIVAEDGREFYAESNEVREYECNDWLRENVLPKLCLSTAARQSEYEIGVAVRKFIGDDTPEFWGYYADYDWVMFCWLQGRMIDLPKGWPMYCRDLKQWSDQIGAPKFEAPNGEHHALVDARWNRDLYKHLESHAPGGGKGWKGPTPASDPTVNMRSFNLGRQAANADWDQEFRRHGMWYDTSTCTFKKVAPTPQTS